MLISELYAKLRQYTVAATSLAVNKVIFANQNSPRPKKPFITIELSGFNNIGTPISRDVDDQGVQQIVTSMRAIVAFSSYCDALHQGEELLEMLKASFNTELQNSIFNGEIAKQGVVKDVSALPISLSEQRESRAIFEIEIAYNRTLDDAVSSIEHVHLHDEISNTDYVIDKL